MVFLAFIECRRRARGREGGSRSPKCLSASFFCMGDSNHMECKAHVKHRLLGLLGDTDSLFQKNQEGRSLRTVSVISIYESDIESSSQVSSPNHLFSCSRLP